METRSLGRSGLSASVVGLGCNNLGRPGTRTETLDGTVDLIRAALDAGVDFFDTADIYGSVYGLSEGLLGLALERLGAPSTVVATKWGHPSIPNPALDALGPKGSRAYIRAAAAGSRQRLKVERIDLFQQHKPDPTVDIAETIGALEELVAEGTIAAYGHSNFSAEQIAAAAAAADRMGAVGFVSAQNEYNLLARAVEEEVLPAVEQAGMGFLPYYPLANGLLTGAFRRDGIPEGTRLSTRPKIVETAPWDALDAFAAFAAARGITMLEATFGWFLARPVVASVIAGATRPDQIRANAAAGATWRPSPAEMAEIDALFPPG